MIFITHNPHHAYPVGDRFVLLKRGGCSAPTPRARSSRDELVQMMAGGAELEELSHELQHFAPAAAAELEEDARLAGTLSPPA